MERPRQFRLVDVDPIAGAQPPACGVDDCSTREAEAGCRAQGDPQGRRPRGRMELDELEARLTCGGAAVVNRS